MADDDRTGMVQVDLDEDDWKQRAEKLASEEAARFALLDKKRTHNAKWNEELIQLRESIKQLTEEVESHSAWVPAQATMFGANDEINGEEPAEEAAPARRRRGGRRGGAAQASA